MTRGTRRQLDSEGIQACLEDDTHVLLAPKPGHFLDTVNIKHYCHLFRIQNCIKCYLVTKAIQTYIKKINGTFFCQQD